MIVENAKTAREWIASWGGTLRPGQKQYAIADFERILSIMRNARQRYSAVEIADIEAALEVIRAA
jgi:hypothetical protein